MTENDLRGLALPLSRLPVGYQGKLTIGARIFNIREVFPAVAPTFIEHIHQCLNARPGATR